MDHHHPVLQQTFTLGPENPTLIVHPHTVDALLTNITSPKHGHSTFISPKGTNQQEMLTTKPAITAKTSTDKGSLLVPGLTDSAISAGFELLHTKGPHDLTVGHADIASLLASHTHMPGSAHDSGHHTHSPGPTHDILLHTHSPGPTNDIFLHTNSPGTTHDLAHHGHTGVLDTTKHKNTQTAKLQPTTAAPKTNDQLNLIVGDWSGADKALSPPPPPPTSNIAMDHSHGHGHFHDHTHGFTEPAIPRPPPLAEAFASSGLPSHSDPTSASVKQSANKVQTSNDKMSAVKGTSISENKKSGFGDVLGMNSNLPATNMEQINSKAGTNLGQGNIRGLNVSFISVLNKNLNKHARNYKSALVYLYDPYIKTNTKANDSLDIVEISLNLTDQPLQFQSANLASRMKQTYTILTKTSSPATAMRLSDLIQKQKHSVAKPNPDSHSLQDISTPSAMAQTQIDSSSLTNSNIRMPRTTPSFSTAKDTYLNDSNSYQNVYDLHNSSLGNNITVTSAIVNATLASNQSANAAASVAVNVTSSAHAAQANVTIVMNTTSSANTTQAAPSSAMTETTTMAGSTTIDPDILADLAEAQEEAAQIAAELAEAGEFVGSTTTVTSANTTPMNSTSTA